VRWKDKKTIETATPQTTAAIPTPAPPTIDRQSEEFTPPPPLVTVAAKVDPNIPSPYPRPGQMVRCIAHLEGKKKVPELKMPVSMAPTKDGKRKTTDGWTIEPSDWLTIWFPA
jgi:hypothetical protein